MKKLGLLFKETSENLIAKRLEENQSLFVINYAKVSGPDFNGLRLALKNTKARVFMVKNSVARRALKNAGEKLTSSIEGSCGIVFSADDPVQTCKVLYTFIQTHDQFKVQAGLLAGGQVLAKQDVETLSKLPPKEQLRADLVGVINAPLSRLTYILKQNLNKLTYYLEQRKDKLAAKP